MITMEQIDNDLKDVNLFDILQIIISVNEELKDRVPNINTDIVIPYSEMCHNPNYYYEEDNLPHRIYHQYVIDMVEQLFDPNIINSTFKPYSEYAVNFIVLSVPSKELFYGDLKLLWLVNHLKNLDIDDMLMYSDTKQKIVEELENEHLKYYDDSYKSNVIKFCNILHEYNDSYDYYESSSHYETIIMSVFNAHNNLDEFLTQHEDIINDSIWYTDHLFRGLNVAEYLTMYINVKKDGDIEFTNIDNIYLYKSLIGSKDIQIEFEY